MSAGKICSRVVVFATGNETVRDAAHRMRENNVGALVVVDKERRPVGILTDRDIVMRSVAEDRDPAYTTIEEIMTQELRTVQESTAIEEALRVMQRFGARRLVVLTDEGKLAGLLSVDDVIELLAEEAAAIRGLLRKEAPAVAV